jgi:hypothetical protein
VYPSTNHTLRPIEPKLGTFWQISVDYGMGATAAFLTARAFVRAGACRCINMTGGSLPQELRRVRHTIYFLIEPKDEARAHFASTIRDFADVLLEQTLVSREFADRSPWREPELALAVKLLYLARLREYDPLSSDADATRILGSASITAETFDRWWSIRRPDDVETSEEMQEYLKAVLAKTPATGNEIVDQWLKWLASPSA